MIVCAVLAPIWSVPATTQTPKPATRSQPKTPTPSQSVPLKAQIAQLQARIDQLKVEVDDLKAYVDARAKVALNDMANGNDNAMLGERIKALETNVDQLKSATGWLYTQQNANQLRRCTVDLDKLRQALRDRYAVSVDVACN